MDALTKQMLLEAGFQSGSVSELLGLDEAQTAIVETKIHLTALLRDERRARGWSQEKLAQAVGGRQQVVARAEAGHRSVTLDWLFRALLALGVSLSRIARELETCEQSVEVQRGANRVELVEIAPLRGLVRPERVAAQTTIYDEKPLLRLMRQNANSDVQENIGGAENAPQEEAGKRAIAS